MTFTENWFNVDAQAVLARNATNVAHLNGRVIEIGCWEGRSTVVLAEAVFPDTVHAVDTWQGSPGEESEALAAERDVYATFLHNIDQLTGGNVAPHRTDWRTYLTQDQSPVRFCHIDAEHSYLEVYDTIAALLPLMVDGGIICGDDNHCIPVMLAVYEHFGNTVSTEASEWWVTP